MKSSWIRIIGLTALLTLIEQGIKIYINANHLTKTVPILPPWLYFSPMFNRDYSWFNSMLKLGISKWVHVASVMVLIGFLLSIYLFVRHEKQNTGLVDVLFSVIFSGALCSLIDKVFWDGSLDYILVKGFFTFDLKDVYVNIFIFLLIAMMLFNYRGLQKMDDKKAWQHYKNFIQKK